MRASWCWSLAAILAASSAPAADPKVKPDSEGKIVRETWDAAFLQGQKTGYYRTTVREFTREGETLRRVTQELHMSVKRANALNLIHAESGDEETADGKVVGVFFRQGLAKNLDLDVSGKINGKVMRVTIQQAGKPPAERKIAWDDDVIGLLAEESLLKDRKAKPGDRITYRLYTPVVTSVVKTVIQVKDWEPVAVNGAARKLLRVESKPEKIEGIQLPMQTLWFDDEYRLVKSQVEMPGLGELTYVRTTKAEAMKPNGQVPNLFDVQSIVLDKPIINPHGRSTLVLRVTLTVPPDDPEDVKNTFVHGDGRQEVKNIRGNTFELHIKAVRAPTATEAKAAVDAKYRQSNMFVNCDDSRVQEHARRAVGDETDPWRKARMIESWVQRNMRKQNFENGIATADHVAKNLEGDCTEYAMLAAAMCRAEGVPSRTAVGLVYHVDRGIAKFSYHMWLEVNVKGQWIALDPTQGYNSVGVAHLKVGDQDWHGAHGLNALLPMMRTLSAKPKVEVLKAGE